MEPSNKSHKNIFRIQQLTVVLLTLALSIVLIIRLRYDYGGRIHTSRRLTTKQPVVSSHYLQTPFIVSAKNTSLSGTKFRNDTVRPLVVGSFTTTPPRLRTLDSDFGKTLKNILTLPLLDRLYLNIPWKYGLRQQSRSNITIESALTKLVDECKGRLRILRTMDYGPATKLLPCLLLPENELPNDSMIITFDDDRLYTPQAVHALVSRGIEFPHSVITIAAWPITILSSDGKRGKAGGPNFNSKIPFGRQGQQYVKTGPVDLILGFYGVLYRKKFFVEPMLDEEIFNYERLPAFMEHCSWVDDIWFSGHLERKAIRRFCIGKVDHSRSDITGLSNVNALSLDKGESVKQNHDNVLCAEAMRKAYKIWQ